MADNPLAAFAPLRILVVDDDPFVSELTADHYRDAGLTVEIARDGREALAAMERCLPDLVLCDRRMPEMSGSELLEVVRSREGEWKNVAFVFVTGLTDHRDRFAMLDLHPDGYICKPLDYDKADADLARIIARRHEPPAA
jgi:DNA-binding response OmpR family regulator